MKGVAAGTCLGGFSRAGYSGVATQLQGSSSVQLTTPVLEAERFVVSSFVALGAIDTRLVVQHELCVVICISDA